MLAALQVWKKNSYFSGGYSAISRCSTIILCLVGFNPCFSGRYSAISVLTIYEKGEDSVVSILVLVEGILQFAGQTAPDPGITMFQSLF